MDITRYYCDRCGKEIFPNGVNRIEINHNYGKRKDLCDKCTSELEDWLRRVK